MSHTVYTMQHTVQRGVGTWQHTVLTPYNGSWYEEGHLPPTLLPNTAEFDDLWGQHPPELGTVRMMGRLLSTPRYQQAMGVSYVFNGLEHTAIPPPPAIQAMLDWANAELGLGSFNQIFVNWYENGHHYIGVCPPHTIIEPDTFVVPQASTRTRSHDCGPTRRSSASAWAPRAPSASATTRRGRSSATSRCTTAGW